MLLVLADTTQLGKLFHVFTTLLVNLNFHRSYFAFVVYRLSHLGQTNLYLQPDLPTSVVTAK